MTLDPRMSDWLGPANEAYFLELARRNEAMLLAAEPAWEDVPSRSAETRTRADLADTLDAVVAPRRAAGAYRCPEVHIHRLAPITRYRHRRPPFATSGGTAQWLDATQQFRARGPEWVPRSTAGISLEY